MSQFMTIVLYLMWSLSLMGILLITFQEFRYEDLNAIVGILFFFTILNTFFSVAQGKKKDHKK